MHFFHSKPKIAESTRIRQQLHKPCSNKHCDAFNSPQAAEGMYVCNTCHKGTYYITADDARLGTAFRLKQHEDELALRQRVELAAERAHRRKLLDERVLRDQASIAKRKEQEAAAAASAQQQHALAERQKREEIIRCHNDEVARMVKDARTQERRTKANGKPPALERRPAQKVQRRQEPPPPAYAPPQGYQGQRGLTEWEIYHVVNKSPSLATVRPGQTFCHTVPPQPLRPNRPNDYHEPHDYHYEKAPVYEQPGHYRKKASKREFVTNADDRLIHSERLQDDIVEDCISIILFILAFFCIFATIHLMAVSPTYTPVNAINWELRDLSNHDTWRSVNPEKENHRPAAKPERKAKALSSPPLLAPRIKLCRDEMRRIADIVSEQNKERAATEAKLLAAEQKAAEDRRRIEELEALVTQAWQNRSTSSTYPAAMPQSWEKEKEELYIQLGDLKREMAQEAEGYAHIQARLEAKTDELHREKAAQAEEIERLQQQLELAAQKEALHTKRLENIQRLQRKATKDRNDVLETLEVGLDEARNEAAACRKQMDEVLQETEKQIAAAEVRGRDAQLKELRALSPRAMLSFLTYPQQQQRQEECGDGWAALN
ncbi:hypothetical protein CPB85DRAFT_1255655 [Mucidula mucida]|nr:hypothetical protein CPB85DRAFT_1255655 [Mucidula mucida]